jgi:hypothetical protein
VTATKPTVSNVDLLDGLITGPPVAAMQPAVGPAMFVMTAQSGFIGMMPTGSAIVSPTIDMVQANTVGSNAMMSVPQPNMGTHFMMGLGDGTNMTAFSSASAIPTQTPMMVSNCL